MDALADLLAWIAGIALSLWVLIWVLIKLGEIARHLGEINNHVAAIARKVLQEPITNTQPVPQEPAIVPQPFAAPRWAREEPETPDSMNSTARGFMWLVGIIAAWYIAGLLYIRFVK